MKSSIRSLRFTFVIVLVCTFVSLQSLFADIPKSPVDFRVHVEAQGQVNVTVVEWEYDTTGGKPTGYKIAYANGVRTRYDSSYGLIQSLPFVTGKTR